MASEINVSTSLLLETPGGISLQRETNRQIDQATPRYSANVQAIGTTYEAVVIGSDIGTPGMAVFVNTDATHYVEIGVEVASTFYPLLKLKPGESAQSRLATGTFFARANVAAVNLETIVCAD